MQRDGDANLYSASDLLTFLGCPHATALDLQALDGSLTAERATDEHLELLKVKGLEHERRHLAWLKAQHRTVVELDEKRPVAERAAATRRAMRDGADVIFQGALHAPPWRGYADFLIRVPTPSALGDWSYEVVDTKLARTAKPTHIVQLCVYSDLIALEQQLLPERVHVVLGDGRTHTERVDDYIHYVRHAQRRFLDFVAGKPGTEAEPCPHCGVCDWSDRCDSEWDASGHLSLVASLGRHQARKLREAGVGTIDALAVLTETATIPRLQTATLARLRQQARLQVHKRNTDEDKAEVLPLEERRGFARLPRPNPGDLFFDMEGDPLYSPEGGLEYLFGFHYQENGRDHYKPFWAKSKSEEKKAFEDSVDFITARLAKHPDAFVYHYASYEVTALKRLALQYGTRPKDQVDALKILAQSYGTRENEVDDLLRARKLVDLYKVVREGIRVSEPRYSLKNLETFYAPARTDAISSGGDSVVAFERWLVTGDDRILQDLADYNAFDCKSTRLCRDWLLTLRPDEASWFNPADEISREAAEREAERRKEDKVVLAMREGLIEKSSDDPADLQWRTLLGYLLEFHRREQRHEWWEVFKRRQMTLEQLIDDSECIGGATLDRSVPPRRVKLSQVWRYKFPDQEYKLSVGSTPSRAEDGKGAGEIMDIDDAAGWFDLKHTGEPRENISLIPGAPFDDEVMRTAIARYVADILEDKDESWPALTGLLKRERPRALVIDQMRDTHLVIQGPPGSGKTYTSAHAIVALVKHKKRVGVMSFTHKAINNLLGEIEEVAAAQGVKFTGIKKSGEPDTRFGGAVIVDTKKNEDVENGSHDVVAGTAWLFARPKMAKKLDYLFVDEGGQVSLANVVAAGLSARNIVLVGDQMQLSQPVKGAHPGGSGVSALEYLMQGHATVPPDRGILLAKTWRMHPDLCAFVSETFYDGRLESAEPTRGQRLIVGDRSDATLAPTGLSFDPIEHDENAQSSEEEAARVNELYRALLGMKWVNQRGETKPITADDILVVSPYNMQVNLLLETLPDGARVGTVDKFQGQEAAVVLVSLAASSGDTAPRGVEFLLEPNRINVAVSRARCLAVLIASPRLLGTSCATINRMRLVNTLCRAATWHDNSD